MTMTSIEPDARSKLADALGAYRHARSQPSTPSGTIPRLVGQLAEAAEELLAELERAEGTGLLLLLPPEPKLEDNTLALRIIEANAKPSADPDSAMAEAQYRLREAPWLSYEIRSGARDLDRALRQVAAWGAGWLQDLHADGILPIRSGFTSADQASRDLAVKASRLAGLIDATVATCHWPKPDPEEVAVDA